MVKPKILIFSGYGLNCEEETKFAFEMAGGKANIIHINDLLSRKKLLLNYQILALPGGFSYGDDTGSGNAYSLKIKNHLFEDLEKFISKDKLIIGICNGFQIMVDLGLLPGFNKKLGKKEIVLLANDSGRYTVRWVDLLVVNRSPWLEKIHSLTLPVAHGEGKFYSPNGVLDKLYQGGQIALKYTKGEISQWHDLPKNPNGSMDDIAGITDPTGKILGLMPHPERALFFTQLPHWTYLKEKYQRSGLKIPKVGPGFKIFQNAINYYQ